jgi:two-component system, OmpR family, sensor kinase
VLPRATAPGWEADESVTHVLRADGAVLAASSHAPARLLDDSAGLRQALESTAEETDRLVRLSNHLLPPADTPLQPEPLDAAALLEVVADRHRRRPDVADRPIRTAATPGLVLVADRVRLEQALSNLVDNAVVHGRGEIELSACTDCAGIRITVADQGPGFPPGFAPHAFQRFRRGASTGPGSGGLGLAIVAAAAQAHGGRAFVDELGPGAVVVLVMPALPLTNDAGFRNRQHTSQRGGAGAPGQPPA